MSYAIILAIGIVVGAYAGEKHAEGKKWSVVLKEMVKETFSFIASVCRTISKPFRKGKDDGPIDVEVVG